MILSTGAHTVQIFVDGVFLMWYSPSAMSASMMAGIAAFSIMAFFIGTASYVNTFVAQYVGADRPHRVGPAVWQGIFFSLAAAAVMLALIPAADMIFDWAGHDETVRGFETTYFKIMCLGAMPALIGSTVSGFYTGRGRTWPVMAVHVVATGVNIGLDYCLIFGRFGFPRWGVAGAAVATIVAGAVSASLFLWLFLRSDNRRVFGSFSGARPDLALFGRLMRFGLPNGVHFMLEMLAFALFLLFLGRISQVAGEASVLTFRVNMLAFMPMIGFGIAVTTLVGQALGKNDSALAQRSTWSAFYMTFGYMTVVAVAYWLVPDLFLSPFAWQADASKFPAVAAVARTLLCFVAFYCLFDTGNIIFSAALKGAGDTRFVMVVPAVLSWVLLVLPTYLAVEYGWGLYVAWGSATAYVCVLALVFLGRFLGGKWKKMRVIEAVHPPIPASVPEVPAIEMDAT